MGKIIVSENVTLDGVIQDPTGDGDFTLGGWFNQMSDSDREAWAQVEYEEALHAEALLLGRRSDEYFGKRWSSRSGAWADRLNSLPKYVVSSTLEQPQWTNVTVLSGEVVAEVSALKDKLDGDVVVYGSGQLVHTLIEHDLVDELRLVVFPCALGAGERLLGRTSAARTLSLIDARTIGAGLAYLTYRVVRNA
jgi:dihydrofolate reductase